MRGHVTSICDVMEHCHRRHSASADLPHPGHPPSGSNETRELPQATAAVSFTSSARISTFSSSSTSGAAVLKGTAMRPGRGIDLDGVRLQGPRRPCPPASRHRAHLQRADPRTPRRERRHRWSARQSTPSKRPTPTCRSSSRPGWRSSTSWWTSAGLSGSSPTCSRTRTATAGDATLLSVSTMPVGAFPGEDAGPAQLRGARTGSSSGSRAAPRAGAADEATVRVSVWRSSCSTRISTAAGCGSKSARAVARAFLVDQFPALDEDTA